MDNNNAGVLNFNSKLLCTISHKINSFLLSANITAAFLAAQVIIFFVFGFVGPSLRSG